MSETENEPNEETEPTPEPTPEPEPEPEELEEEEEHAHPPEPPEPEPPQAQGLSQAEWDERFKKADRSWQTYQRRIGELWEEDALTLVAFNFSPSAPPGFMAAADAGRVPDETKAGLLEWLGFAREQDYEPDPDSQECPTCKGKGHLQRHSKVAGKNKRTCPRCRGEGDITLSGDPIAVSTNGSPEETFTLAEPTSAAAPDADNWGEPRILPDGRENPNYGRQPQYKVPVEPWGLTAGLGVQDVAAGG